MSTNPTINFDLAFNQTGTAPNLTGGSKFTYDSSNNSFALSEPLQIGTMEDLGSSAAEIFGADFPDTSDIPVLGALMNKISFTIKEFDYTEATKTESNSYTVKVEGDISDVKIGVASLTSATFSISKTATAISS